MSGPRKFIYHSDSTLTKENPSGDAGLLRNTDEFLNCFGMQIIFGLKTHINPHWKISRQRRGGTQAKSSCVHLSMSVVPLRRLIMTISVEKTCEESLTGCQKSHWELSSGDAVWIRSDPADRTRRHQRAWLFHTARKAVMSITAI